MIWPDDILINLDIQKFVFCLLYKSLQNMLPGCRSRNLLTVLVFVLEVPYDSSLQNGQFLIQFGGGIKNTVL